MPETLFGRGMHWSFSASICLRMRVLPLLASSAGRDLTRNAPPRTPPQRETAAPAVSAADLEYDLYAISAEELAQGAAMCAALAALHALPLLSLEGADDQELVKAECAFPLSPLKAAAKTHLPALPALTPAEEQERIEADTVAAQVRLAFKVA